MPPGCQNPEMGQSTSTERAGFDPSHFKAEQRTNWDAASAGALRYYDDLETGLAPVTERLLRLADLRPGQSVIDLATGYGEPALTAAAVAGPTGRVVGVDISPGMVAVARGRADRDNVTFVEGDFESLPDAAPFDVALSRFGLMLAVDHVATFRGIRRILAPGGVLAAAVWAAPASNLFAIGVGTLARLAGMDTGHADEPGTFSMADPEQLRRELRQAGFTDVSIEQCDAPFRFPDVDRYLEVTRSLVAPGLVAAATRSLGTAERVWAAIADAVSPHRAPDGTLSLPSTAHCLRAAVG